MGMDDYIDIVGRCVVHSDNHQFFQQAEQVRSPSKCKEICWLSQKKYKIRQLWPKMISGLLGVCQIGFHKPVFLRGFDSMVNLLNFCHMIKMFDVQNFLLFQLFQLAEWVDEPPGVNSPGRTAGLGQDRNGTNLILEPQVD